MSGLRNSTAKRKNNGAAPVSTPDTPAPGTPLPITHPKKRNSFFARQIWSVERRLGFAFSSLYGHGK